MTHTPLRKRAAAYTCAAAIIGASALVAGPASTASAAAATCDASEFCLYYGYTQGGGIYEYSGSDSNLGNDHFENAETTTIVSNNAYSAWNRGTGNGYYDVLVSDGTNAPNGETKCIKQGRKVNDLGDLKNRVSSYKWVTRATCNTYPQL